MPQETDRISRVMFQYGARIWRERDKSAQLAAIANMTRDLVDADRCTIWIYDSENRQIYTRIADGISEIRIPAGQGLVGSCIASGEASVVNSPADDPRFSGNIDKSSGYKTESILTVPLRGVSGDVIGACQVLNKPGGFNADDVDLVGLAASFSAEAIENLELQKARESARRMQFELEIARDVQQNLLPREVPENAFVECAAACRPAYEVGGDYYNFWSAPDGAFSVALGDVAGKGISAALIMASAQASLSGLLVHGLVDFAAVLGELNKFIYATSPPERYSTLFFAQYNPRAGTLTYVNAGHPPPVIYHASGDTAGAVTRLRVGGMPVGLLPDSTFQQATVPFSAGDILVCYSDGINESMNSRREEWGEKNLIAAIRGASHLPAMRLTDEIMDQAMAFAAGAPQHDDMTALVLRPRS